METSLSVRFVISSQQSNDADQATHYSSKRIVFKEFKSLHPRIFRPADSSNVAEESPFTGARPITLTEVLEIEENRKKQPPLPTQKVLDYVKIEALYNEYLSKIDNLQKKLTEFTEIYLETSSKEASNEELISSKLRDLQGDLSTLRNRVEELNQCDSIAEASEKEMGIHSKLNKLKDSLSEVGRKFVDTYRHCSIYFDQEKIMDLLDLNKDIAAPSDEELRIRAERDAESAIVISPSKSEKAQAPDLAIQIQTSKFSKDEKNFLFATQLIIQAFIEMNEKEFCLAYTFGVKCHAVTVVKNGKSLLTKLEEMLQSYSSAELLNLFAEVNTWIIEANRVIMDYNQECKTYYFLDRAQEEFPLLNISLV